jgi:hypothetical protein
LTVSLFAKEPLKRYCFWLAAISNDWPRAARFDAPQYIQQRDLTVRHILSGEF